MSIEKQVNFLISYIIIKIISNNYKECPLYIPFSASNRLNESIDIGRPYY